MLIRNVIGQGLIGKLGRVPVTVIRQPGRWDAGRDRAQPPDLTGGSESPSRTTTGRSGHNNTTSTSPPPPRSGVTVALVRFPFNPPPVLGPHPPDPANP